MQGNIFGWCTDWFNVNNTKKNIPSKEGTYHVLIGGQFTGRVKHTRAADGERSFNDLMKIALELA